MLRQHWTVGHSTGECTAFTFADCPVPRVARLTRAAVASDHVEAQRILITVVEPAEALVMFWKTQMKSISMSFFSFKKKKKINREENAAAQKTSSVRRLRQRFLVNRTNV